MMPSPDGDKVAKSPSAESIASADGPDDAMALTNDIATASPPESDRDGSPAADLPEDIDEESALKELSATARDQDDLERDISHQASLALMEVEDNRDKNRIIRAEATKLKFMNQKKAQQDKLKKAWGKPALVANIKQEIARIDAEIELVDKDLADLSARIEKRHEAGTDAPSTETATGKLPGEAQRDFLIRTGKITPFAKIGGSREGVIGDLANAIIDAEDEAVVEDLENQLGADQIRSHQNLRLPGFAEDDDDVGTAAVESEFSLRPRKKRRTKQAADSSDEFEPTSAASPESTGTGASDDYDMTDLTRVKSRKQPKASKAAKDADGKVDFSKIDDGNESAYQSRLADWVERRSRARRRKQDRSGLTMEEDEDEEWFKPSPDQPDHQFENGLKLPGDIYPSLFDYQKTGVQWLAELYEQNVGGIVGDEMGLGKTIQIISFLAALHYSKKLTKPVIVVAPATVLQQWVGEFHRWWPPLRVSILHSSGSGMLNVRNEGRYEDEDLDFFKSRPEHKKSSKSAKDIVDRVINHGHVLVTTYAGLQTYADVLLPVVWEYAVLDEGHKIRNPNTTITIDCKGLETPNRVILSGTPMQNNLIELWSLFDFVNPMRLGSLVAFRNQFEVPIRLGGYANATNVQVMTAQKCAETLKDAISPYLLQRTKKDVAADLPKKSEQVLFCKLTRWQRDAYETFLRSEDMTAILNRTRQSFSGIDHLRKICNHPDLAYPKFKERVGYKWGSASKSGKMQVVKSLVNMWKRLGHKTLLFSQSVQMLDILEGFVRRQEDIKYVRMDGKTAISQRQKLVDQFNNDPDIHVFLLTTKVGGLGVNLTGANRVIIYDPDWNPSTDVQARERAWRLGQKKDVTIYRLMTAGTIEEKIYQRQIFKQYLANKVLKDPKQRTTLNLSDLHDLFTLGTDHANGTETSQLFSGSKVESKITPKSKITPGAGNYDLQDQHARVEAMLRNKKDEEDKKQLEEIDGVAGLEEYKDGEDGGDADGEEDRLMAGIFAKGIHEALEHEEVISGSNGKRVVRADRAILQREADRVASAAAQHLYQAAQEAQNVPIGTVTWTGQVGEAGRPRPTNVRGGRPAPRTNGLLAGIRDRQGIAGSSSAGSSRSGTPTLTNRYGVKQFKEMIPPFIERHGGKVPSKVLVDHFNQYCKDKKTTDAFKAALDVVAKLSHGGSTMRGIWSLKSEYKK